MLNQLNIFDPNTYSTLRTVDHDVFFPAIQDMLQAQANAPQITYLDLGQDGVNTQISTQTDIPTHTGVVSFDSKTYKIGDTVTITVNDQDLNTNNDLVVIYTAVTPNLERNWRNLYKMLAGNSSMVTYKTQQSIQSAKQVLEQLSDGHAFGRLLDIQWGQQDIRWSNSRITISTQTPGNTASCFTNSTGAFVDSNTGHSGWICNIVICNWLLTS